MTDNGAGSLRAAITGLIAFTAAEEELVLLADPAEAGSAERWAAVPIIAHNTDFKHQQVQRLAAIQADRTPPDFAEIDHRSAQVYRELSQRPAARVRQASREVTAALIDGLARTSDPDLLDPSRNSWLNGRQLWLQIIVRGFWHPTGHLAEYYASHGRPGRAAEMQQHAVATATYLRAPDAALGMAHYNLACTQAVAGQAAAAVASLERAIGLNAALVRNASGDADLAALREAGQLDAVLPG